MYLLLEITVITLTLNMMLMKGSPWQITDIWMILSLNTMHYLQIKEITLQNHSSMEQRHP